MTTRYTVRVADNGGYYIKGPTTYIGEGAGFYTGHLSEAEANIIAFALNAVAEGYGLYWCARSNDVLTPYTGPTEGVAPHAD